MGSIWLRHTWVAAFGTLLLLGIVQAQEPVGETPPAPAARPQGSPPPAVPAVSPATAPASPPAPAPIREEHPAVFLLPDGKDGYKPVINFQLEKFKQLLELEQQMLGGTAKPSYAVELSGSGSIDDNRARLELDFQFAVPGDDWVRIPLRLDEAVIVAQKHEGSGEHILAPADDGQGYVAWLRTKDSAPIRLKITALAPVTRVGGEARLKLALPRLTTSQFTLKLPFRDAAVRTPQGTLLERVAAPAGNTTVVRVVGATGGIDLAWRESLPEIGRAPMVLSVNGASQVQIDGQAATTTAQLNVSAAEGAVERFMVSLPRGATLISGESPGYSITKVAAPPAAGDAEKPALQYEVRPLDKAEKQVALRLITEQLLPAPGAVEFVDLAGFEVQGARQQTGFLALRVVGDWQLVFGDRRNVREVPLGDLPASLRAEELAAGFEYLAQPSSLLARLVPRRPRVAVEPVYHFRVTADAIELEARLKYTVRGARVFALDLEFPDEAWEIEEIGPAGLVDLDGVLFEQLQPLSVPLLQPGSGELELRCRARRPLTPEQNQISFRLPRPLANSVGPARVIVLPADNVELSPRSAEMAGLGRQAAAAAADLPAQQREPLVYRGDVDKAYFSADRRVLKQSIEVQTNTQILLSESAVSVEQQLRYLVRYEPLERLTLRVPAPLLESRSLEVLLDGQRVQWLRSAEAETASADTELASIPLPKPLLGPVELRLQFALPEQKLTPRVSVPLSIPLVSAEDVVGLRNEATVVSRLGLQVQTRGEGWKIVEQAAGGAAREQQLRLSSAMPGSKLELALSLEDPEAFGATVIDRMWIQTWLGERQRQDRAVLRLSSRQPSVRLLLPEGTVPALVEVQVDGQRVASQVGSEGGCVIPLPTASASDQHTIEVAYDLPRAGGIEAQLVPPRCDDEVRVGNSYWQIVLPKHQHVVTGPGNFGAEFAWGWQGYYWGRQPLLEQFDLEAWSGAGRRAPLPNTTNRYLYSTLGPAANLELRIVPRWLIVLLASGAALVLGLGVVYLPALRQPALIWTAILGLIAVGLVYPEATLMILQAASLGALLTVVAGLLKRRAMRRHPARAGSTLIRPGSSISGRTLNEPAYRPALAGSNSSTETGPLKGPLAGHFTGPDSKS